MFRSVGHSQGLKIYKNCKKRLVRHPWGQNNFLLSLRGAKLSFLVQIKHGQIGYVEIKGTIRLLNS